VLSVNPFDVEATAAAMHTGLTMDSEERHRFNEGARNVVRTNDIARWISNQVQDLRELVAPAPPHPPPTAGTSPSMGKSQTP
jgi:trehalose 6-phosphate synthase